MKEKWINDLRDGLSDYEMDAPEGLWESLGVESSVSPVGWWHRKIAVVAAVIALLIVDGGILLWHGGVQDIRMNDKMTAVSSLLENHNEGLHTSAEACPMQSTGKAAIRHRGNNVNLCAILPTQEASVISPVEAILPLEHHEDSIGLTQNIDTIYILNPTPPEDGSLYTNISHKRKINTCRNSRVAIAAYASGFGNTSGNQGRLNLYPDLANGFPLYSDPIYADPAPGLPENNLITVRTNYHQPIRIGVTFQYNITDRIGVETGLMYTALTTDISLGQDNKASYGQRRMQYIGIPLNVKMSAWSWKVLDLYLSAGVMGEKCVGNRFEAKTVAEGLPLDSYTRQKDRPFQWSVNACAGLQIRPMRNIGLFAEPGVSHYFNDGSSIETIYKDRPWTFNLNVGIRWILNH